ncbi:Prokaryotic diacylglycerol kinase [Planktothrix serta PCC 8927]|uniref:Prokaryotic diacylglycerol kinase n=1 Tax=Planktothrix serta PCC 8927 TaxID=671068 RepID=A0A7Z9BRR4_9CYAN|nr:diacylglycerol kinase family protein [Planktothrix serta]VXD21041.1 Prokaryotic diacylglycerol kinase [Planktothrix serta PCC 8927]
MNAEKPSLSTFSTPLISLPQGTTLSKSNLSDAMGKKYDRELSWKIASNLLVSFKYAWTGISYTFRTQRNFRIHTIIGTLAISLGLFLHLTIIEIAIIGLTIGAVMTMELLNTAIESVVDLTVGQSYHDLARIAKDCAAAAVLISAIVALFVAAILLLPPLITWINVTLIGV